MADESTLKIEVSSTGADSSASSASSKGATFADIKAADNARVQSFRDAERQRRNEKESAERLAAKEREKRKQADSQERDESWLARQQAKEAKRKAAESARAERQQNRDEDYAARQDVKDGKGKAAAAKRSAAQQKRDEDFADRQDRRSKVEMEKKRQRDWWSNPHNVAQNLIQRQKFGAQVRGSHMAQRLGFSANSSVTKLAGSANMLAGRFVPLIAIASALYGAWKAARQNLLEEANKVRYLSPDLKMQEMVNKMRNMRTDAEIASKYGERMAELEDRENRRENAWRLIGAKVSSAIDSALSPITDPLEERYTQLLEYFAGTNKENEQTNKYLKELTGLTKQQLDEMGIKNGMRESIAYGLKNAEKVLKTLGADGFKQTDEMTELLGKPDKLQFNPNNNFAQDNPGLIPVPAWWRDR